MLQVPSLWSPRPLTAVEPESSQTNLQGRVQWHTVSSVTCHVTWRVVEMQGATGLFKTKKTICSDWAQEPAIRVVSVRFREWNCSCSN